MSETATIETTEQRECETCGIAFPSFSVQILGTTIRARHCAACVDAHNAASESERPDTRAAEWSALCPAEFRTLAEGGETDPARLARDCSGLPKVEGWQFGARGLLLRGDTGHCKTRAVWRLLRRQFDAGRSIVTLSSGQFSRDFADASGNFTRKVWFEWLANTDIFFLDDLGKGGWTANVWGEFFELVDERYKHRRPVILTTNETGGTLKSKCPDPVTWEPLYRRLTENCEVIIL